MNSTLGVSILIRPLTASMPFFLLAASYIFSPFIRDTHYQIASALYEQLNLLKLDKNIAHSQY